MQWALQSPHGYQFKVSAERTIATQDEEDLPVLCEHPWHPAHYIFHCNCFTLNQPLKHRDSMTASSLTMPYGLYRSEHHGES